MWLWLPELNQFMYESVPVPLGSTVRTVRIFMPGTSDRNKSIKFPVLTTMVPAREWSVLLLYVPGPAYPESITAAKSTGNAPAVVEPGVCT